MTFLAQIKKIVGGEQRVTADDVRATIAKTAAFLAELEAKRAVLGEQRVAALLSGSDSDVKRVDEQLAALKLDRERVEAALEVLTERRDILVDAERVERGMRERAELDERVASVAEKLAKRYPMMVAELRDLVREIAEADAAVVAFHRAHPDAPELIGVEARARFQGSTRRVIHESETWCWRAPNGALFTHEQAADVRPEVPDEPTRGTAIPKLRAVEAKPRRWLDEIGAGRASASSVYRSRYGAGHKMVPVRVMRRIVEVTAANQPEPLAKSLRLPALRAGQPGFEPLSTNDPRLVLAALALPPAAPEPEQKIELVEIKEEQPE